MRALVIFHSRTGNTRKIAELTAERLGGELAALTCPSYSGALGSVRQAWDMLTQQMPTVALPASVRNQYDLLVVGGPVWAGHPAPPLRSLLRNALPDYRAIALFLTCSGTSRRFSGEKALDETIALAGRVPIATRLFKEVEIMSPQIPERVARFADMLVRLTPGGQMQRSPDAQMTGPAAPTACG